MNKGIIIDIEGLDGSGKETQAKLLYETVASKHFDKAYYVSFPDYGSQSSSVVKMYLSGELGNNPLAVNAYAVSSFFAVDRFVSFNKIWKKTYTEGGYVIANRYTASNAIYQLPKIERKNWGNYLKWCYDYEYNKLGLPEPEIIIYLDVPIAVSQKLMDKRYSESSGCKDLHESNIEFLKLCRAAGIYAAKRDKWSVVNCVSNNKLRSINDIHEEIIYNIKSKGIDIV